MRNHDVNTRRNSSSKSAILIKQRCFGFQLKCRSVKAVSVISVFFYKCVLNKSRFSSALKININPSDRPVFRSAVCRMYPQLIVPGYINQILKLGWPAGHSIRINRHFHTSLPSVSKHLSILLLREKYISAAENRSFMCVIYSSTMMTKMKFVCE